MAGSVWVLNILLFICFASLGAGIRYGLGFFSYHIAYGVLFANAFGSFLIGVTASGVLQRNFPSFPQAVFAVAFLGALTSFSSFALECVSFLEKSNWFGFVVVFFTHNVISIFCCWVGMNQFRIAS